MKDPDTYLREFTFPQEHIREIVQRAQRDAYDEGYRQAARQMFAIAAKTTEVVDKLTVEALAQ
jgi:hypothetical protein